MSSSAWDDDTADLRGEWQEAGQAEEECVLPAACRLSNIEAIHFYCVLIRCPVCVWWRGLGLL